MLVLVFNPLWFDFSLRVHYCKKDFFVILSRISMLFRESNAGSPRGRHANNLQYLRLPLVIVNLANTVQKRLVNIGLLFGRFTPK
jgi:hypothetical protein